MYCTELYIENLRDRSTVMTCRLTSNVVLLLLTAYSFFYHSLINISPFLNDTKIFNNMVYEKQSYCNRKMVRWFANTCTSTVILLADQHRVRGSFFAGTCPAVGLWQNRHMALVFKLSSAIHPQVVAGAFGRPQLDCYLGRYYFIMLYPQCSVVRIRWQYFYYYFFGFMILIAVSRNKAIDKQTHFFLTVVLLYSCNMNFYFYFL